MKPKSYPTRERLRDLFDYADGEFYWRVRPANCIQIGDKAGTSRPGNYTQIRLQGKAYYLHRLVWIWHYEDVPEGLQVDHINECKTDNRIENLQLLTPRQNRTKNSTLTKKSGLPTGVRIDSKTKRYVAQIHDSSIGYQRGLGYFDTAEEAHAAYVALLDSFG